MEREWTRPAIVIPGRSLTEAMVSHVDRGKRRRSSSAPFVLLFLALAAAFAFDRGHVIRISAGFHGIYAATVAWNLAPEHHFLQFFHQTMDPDGGRTYVPYNRFPVFGYVLIKAAMLPFADDVVARLFAARLLMLAFFAGAATVAWLALRRLARNGWAALAATLLSFSSYAALSGGDVVSTEGVVDLFAVMLAFHGMAVFATEGRFRQLVVKTCAALLLGWHVYALLLPYAVFELAAALRRRDKGAVRRQLTLGFIALLFGSAVLAANFTREYAALGGEESLADLPSVESALRRTGIAPRGGEVDWPFHAVMQMEGVAEATVPYAANHLVGNVLLASPEARRHMRFAMAGFGFVSVLCAIVLVISPATRHRCPLAALLLSGPCWQIAFHHNAGGYENLFFICIPLVLFMLTLLRLGRGGGALAAAAAAIFGLSGFLMARTLQDPDDAAVAKAMAADMESIRDLVEGKTIHAPRIAPIYDERLPVFHPFLAELYFGDRNVIVRSHDTKHFADVVLGERLAGARTLTPGNELLFLYDPADYDAYWIPYERHAEQGAPILKIGDYDVHLVRRNTRNELLYVRGGCPSVAVMRYGEFDAGIFLHAYPRDVNDLPADDRRYGFDDLDFGFWNNHWRKDGKCYGVRRLPDYGIARIHTGRITMSHRRLLRKIEMDALESEQGWYSF